MDYFERANSEVEKCKGLIEKLNIYLLEGAIIRRKINMSRELIEKLSKQFYELGVSEETILTGKYDKKIVSFVKNNGIDKINLDLNDNGLEDNDVVKNLFIEDMKNRSVELKENEFKKVITNEDGTLNIDKITNDAFNKDVQVLMGSKEEEKSFEIEKIADIDQINLENKTLEEEKLEKIQGEVISDEEYNNALTGSSNKEEPDIETADLMPIENTLIKEEPLNEKVQNIVEPLLIEDNSQAVSVEADIAKIRKERLQKLSANYSMNGKALDQLETTGVYYYRDLKNLNTSKIKNTPIENIVIGIKKAKDDIKAKVADVNLNNFVYNASTVSPEMTR